MTFLSKYSRAALVLMALATAVCCGAGCKKAAPAATAKPAASTVGAKTNGVPATNDMAMAYVSVFEDLLPPQGKDPFYPNSHRREPAPTPQAQAAKPPPPAVLELKGILRSANRRLAVINNATLEPGDSGSVRVPDGHVRVKCLTIGDDYVDIRVDGESQSKRLYLRKKE
jgi:hypothetical protein